MKILSISEELTECDKGAFIKYLFVQTSCHMIRGKEQVQSPERFKHMFRNIVLIFSILSGGCAAEVGNYLKVSRGPALCGPLSKSYLEQWITLIDCRLNYWNKYYYLRRLSSMKLFLCGIGTKMSLSCSGSI